jgi:chromosome segregation protein
VQSELDTLRQDPAAQALLQLQQEREAAQLTLEATEAQAHETEERLQQAREQQQQRQQRLTDLRQQVAREAQEIASLKASLNALAGDGEAVQQWLTHWQLQRSPQVLSLLQADAPWSQVAEWVLGHWLQSHVLPAPRLTEALWEQIPELRMSWLTDAAPEVPIKAGTLAEVVQAPNALRPLLNQVFRASTRQAAQSLLATLPPQASVITPDGLWLGQGWVRVFRAAEDHAGLLQQKDRLAQLQHQVDETEFELEDAQLNHEAAQLSLESLTQDWQQQRGQLEQARQELHGIETRISALDATQQQMAQSVQRAEQDLVELEAQMAQSVATIEEADAALAEQPDPTSNPAGDALQNQRDELRVRLADARASLRDQDAALQALTLEMNTLRNQESSLNAALARSAEQHAQWQAREQSVQASLALSSEPEDDVSEELEHWVGQQLEQQAALDDARVAVEQFHEQMRELDQQRLAAEQLSHSLQQTLQDQNLAQERLRVRQSTIEEQLREQQFDLATLQQQLPDGLNVAESEQRIEQLLQRIQRLGPINLAAIDEYQIQQERQTYLAAQQADLEEALKTLESAIRRIDQETRHRFKATFDQINAGLQALFPKVFGGGHAYLAMTGEDLLDTGVTIMARPPGKRNATIHLLSGGEKALTAIALVFSIFRLNPAPFCLLDEVDAPLDDANVMRFARLVETMSEQVEFVYITHNKVAMEMAHQLMGVTMTEPGVSRLVAVNVDEALELTES